MKPIMSMLGAALIGLSAAGAASAQDAPPPATAPGSPSAAVAAEDWHPFSRSAAKAYLADVGHIGQGDVVTIRMARVSLNAPAPGNYSYIADEYEFQCAAGQVRTVASNEYGPDGVAFDRYEDASPWEDIPDRSLDAYLKALACDGDRATPPTWPSIKAFIDAGRP